MDHVTEYYLAISLSESLMHLNADPQRAYANEDHWVKPHFIDDRHKQGEIWRQRAHQHGNETSLAEAGGARGCREGSVLTVE